VLKILIHRRQRFSTKAWVSPTGRLFPINISFMIIYLSSKPYISTDKNCFFNPANIAIFLSQLVLRKRGPQSRSCDNTFWRIRTRSLIVNSLLINMHILLYSWFSDRMRISAVHSTVWIASFTSVSLKLIPGSIPTWETGRHQ